MSEIVLRPYQEKFIDDVRREFSSGSRKVCGVAPCGAGKTIMTGWMIREAEKNGYRSIFFVHRKELIDQTSATFWLMNIPNGIIAADEPLQLNYPVQIASVQTLIRRLDRIWRPNLLICDECHHILADSYKKIIEHWNKAYLLGVTATPERRGGVRLGDVFDSMVMAPNVNELIELGNLTPFRYYAPPNPNFNLDGVKTNFGDYDNRQLEERMTNAKIVGNIVEHYKRLAGGKSAICYCVNVEHSKFVAENFNAAGIAAAQCDGETPKATREQIVVAFRSGRIKVLCNAELFGEGFDLPSMDVVILARPTKSLPLFIQQSMRPMRPDPKNPNKVAIILDHVGNCTRFGLPNEPHDWSLAPNEKKDRKAPPKLKICKGCETIVPAQTRICPYCGFKFADDRTYDFNETEEDLREITYNAQLTYNQNLNAVSKVKDFKDKVKYLVDMRERRNYKKGWVVNQAEEYARTLEDWKVVEKALGYKRGWSKHKWQAIQEKAEG